MRRLSGTVAALAIGMAGAVSAAPRIVDGPGASSVTMRAGPDPLYFPVRPVADGTRVEVLQGADGWGLVRLPNGASGWVPLRNLASPARYRPAQPAPARVRSQARAAPAPAAQAEPVEPYTSVVYPSSGRLNLRAGPGTRYPVVRSMPRGSWVEVKGKAGSWVRVRHDSGAEGWTFQKYLTR